MTTAEMRMRLHADYLRKVDVTSSAHGFEVRVPFLDNRMLEFAAAFPSNTSCLSRRDQDFGTPARTRCSARDRCRET